MTKTILITGASRGIGRASALLCGRRGWNVGVNYASNAAAAAETVAAIEAAGGKAVAISGNVASEDDVVAMFDATEAAFGAIDGVVNNAGILETSLPIAEHTVERWRRVLDVNIIGAMLVARETARRLARSRGGNGGALVNISSAATRIGGANAYVDYAASKGAINALTVGLVGELGPEGIRVNIVSPGLIDTDIHALSGWAERAKELGKSVPLGRDGSAEEVAEAVVWLLSDQASYVAGANLDVTGGR